MAFKINYDDPQYQQALRRVSPYAATSGHAQRRGLVSGFTAQQANKLQAMDAAGDRLTESRKNFDLDMRMRRENLALRQRTFKDVKRGMKWALPIQIGTLGVGLLEAHKDQVFKKNFYEQIGKPKGKERNAGWYT